MKHSTKFTALIALVATLICALIAGVTLLAMPKTVMTASAETENVVARTDTATNKDDFLTKWEGALTGSSVSDNRAVKIVLDIAGEDKTIKLDSRLDVTATNLLLYGEENSTRITITGKLRDTNGNCAEICVGGESETVITSGYSETNGGVLPSMYFKADNGKFVMLKEVDGNQEA